MSRIQYITDDRGNKISVIVPLKDYQKMIEELEELEDIHLYDKAKKSDTGERISMEEAFKRIETGRKKNLE